MFSFWNDVEAVTRLYHVAAVCLAISTVFSVVFGLRQYQLGKLQPPPSALSEQRLAELEKRETPRLLTANEQSTFGKALENKPRGKIQFSIPANDSKSRTVADQLAGIMER